MSARARLINLLPPSEFEGSFWGRFLKWASTAGRKVVIVTEMVVILAFLSRFKLDEDIRRINEEITGKRNLLEASMPFEDRFKSMKNQITAAKIIEKQQLNASVALEEVAKQVPFEVRLDNVQISKNRINVTGLSIDEKALGEMLSRMDKNANWKSIDLVSLDSKINKGVTFVINIYD